MMNMDTSASTPAASVVIPLFNRVELTAACWESLVAHTGTAEVEVVFVDNGSADGTAAFLRGVAGSAAPPATVLSNAENQGFAKACNQGARAARGGVVVFLNNDTVVHENWLAPLAAELADHPETGVAGAKLLYPDGTVQHAGVCVNRWNIPYHVFLGAAPDDPLVSGRRAFPMVTGACMAVRREEFLALGGFDEGYVNGHEDVDLCLRYAEAGLRSVYRPDSVVTHHESQSEGRMAHCRANTQRTLDRWLDRLVQDDFNYDFPESERLTASDPLSIVLKIPAEDKRAAPPPATLRAEGLARELCRRGHRVRIHAVPDWDRTMDGCDLVLAVPGPRRYVPKPGPPCALLTDGTRDGASGAGYAAALSLADPFTRRDFDEFETSLRALARAGGCS
ncbi:glycosyltransferase family 2 protein [Pseudodesulfovibrio sp.]|uniref:glycosyltransferase family 2 protein n=1 Tax=Pseudodesulfovibrio sp. TaxID=2035812 RepID=UPI003D0B8F46